MKLFESKTAMEIERLRSENSALREELASAKASEQDQRSKLSDACDALRRAWEKVRAVENEMAALRETAAREKSEARVESARANDLATLRWAMIVSILRQQPHQLVVLRADRMIQPLRRALDYRIETLQPHPEVVVWELHGPEEIN